jgi:signal transduction histidine kinase
MKRLYLRIYLAVLASLAIFAVLAALGWKLGVERDRAGRDERALIAEVIAEILPSADAPPDAQRAALERWQKRSGVDLAVFDAQRRPIAAAGRPLPPPASSEGGRESGWGGGDDVGLPVWSVRLPDGRWAVARPWRARGGPSFAWGALLLALGLATAIGAYPLVRRITRRLERLQAGVEALGSGDLSARVAVQGRDEIALLATSFNRSAERIEALMGAQRSLLANASHELKSPLARLRMAVTLLAERRAGGAPGTTDDAAAAELRREVERNVGELDALVDEILLASRLDAGAGIVREPVDLVALLAEACARVRADLEIVAGQSGERGAADGAAAAIEVIVPGDPRLLRRLVRNLLENARRHGAGTTIDVVLRAGTGPVEVDVCDRGPGVPEAERERIFEPFFRLAGHGEAAGGIGLGLALVRQIAHRHGADVRCLPREGGGSCFRVSFGRFPIDAHQAIRPGPISAG